VAHVGLRLVLPTAVEVDLDLAADLHVVGDRARDLQAQSGLVRRHAELVVVVDRLARLHPPREVADVDARRIVGGVELDVAVGDDLEGLLLGRLRDSQEDVRVPCGDRLDRRGHAVGVRRLVGVSGEDLLHLLELGLQDRDALAELVVLDPESGGFLGAVTGPRRSRREREQK
jgi:hypothetical protein